MRFKRYTGQLLYFVSNRDCLENIAIDLLLILHDIMSRQSNAYLSISIIIIISSISSSGDIYSHETKQRIRERR